MFRVNQDRQIHRETRRVEEMETAVPMFHGADMWRLIMVSPYLRRDLTFDHDSMTYIDQAAYGLPGDFNEEADWR